MANAAPSDRAKEIIAIADGLFSRRINMVSLWQQIADHFYPERADFTVLRTPGREFADHLMTGYPVMLRRDLANSFSTMLRPTGRPWFKSSTGRDEIDKEHEVAEWLDQADATMRRILYDRRAQFVKATKQGDHDYAAFGNAVLTVEEHPSGVGLFFRCWHLRDVAWADNELGEVDTVARMAKMTARGLVQRFGFDRVASQVQRLAAKEPFAEINCYAIVIPAEVWDLGREGERPSAKAKRLARFPFVALYVDRDHNHVMAERPVRVNPYVIPRWQLTTQSVYGYSPATMVGLPDARLIQRMRLSMLEASEKAVDPPLVAVGEALRGGAQLFAGGITYIDPDYDERTGEALRPLFNTQTFEPAKEEFERQMVFMERAFYLNALHLPDTSGMTAFEVSKRVEEFIRNALPLFEPLESEYNGQVLDKAFTIAMMNNAFGPPDEIPEALLGRDIEWTFTTPLQRAVDEMKAQKLLNGLQVAGAAAGVDQGVFAALDIQEASNDALRGLDWPEEWFRDDDEREAALQALDQQAQQKAMLEAGGQGAAIAADVGKAAQSFQRAA